MSNTTPQHTTTGLALTALLAIVANAHAEDARSDAASALLAPVVVTGTPLADDGFDRPYAIDVIDVGEFRYGNAGINVSEVLSRIPGVVARNRHNYAQDLQLSVRGFGSRTAFGVRGVKLVSDGIPANTPDGQGQAAVFNLDTAERIEVLRGPFAALGGNHSGGLIRLESRRGSGTPKVDVRLLAGAWATSRIGASAEGEHAGVAYLLDASRFRTGGFRPQSASQRDQSFAKLDLAPSMDSTLSLVVSALEQPFTQDPQGVLDATWRRNARATESPALAFDTRKRISHQQGGLRYVHRAGNDTLTLTAYAGARRVVQYQSIPTAPQANPRHAGGVIDLDRRFEGLGLQWSRTFELATRDFELDTGIDFDRSRDDRRGYENFVGSRLGVRGALRRDEVNRVSNVSPYVIATLHSGPWEWSAGMRHNRIRFSIHDQYIRPGNPDDSGRLGFAKNTVAIGVSYALGPSVQLHASTGRGFETPTMNELSYATPESGFNFGLRPARSLQFELGLKSLLGSSTRFDATLFSIRTQDEIVVSASEGGRASYANAARTRRHGVELSIESALTQTLTAHGALTLIDARYSRGFTSGGAPVASGNRMPGISRLTAFGELAWRPSDGLRIAVEAERRSRIFVDDANDGRPAPAHTLVHLSLAAEQRVADWTFGQTLRIDNALDRRHVASVIVGAAGSRFYEPGPPRSWFAGIRASHRF